MRPSVTKRIRLHPKKIQPYSRGWSLTSKKPFLFYLNICQQKVPSKFKVCWTLILCFDLICRIKSEPEKSYLLWWKIILQQTLPFQIISMIYLSLKAVHPFPGGAATSHNKYYKLQNCLDITQENGSHSTLGSAFDDSWKYKLWCFENTYNTIQCREYSSGVSQQHGCIREWRVFCGIITSFFLINKCLRWLEFVYVATNQPTTQNNLKQL